MKININWDTVRKYAGRVFVIAGVSALIYVSSVALTYYFNHKEHPKVIQMPIENSEDTLIHKGVCYKKTNDDYSLTVINDHVYEVMKYYLKCEPNTLPEYDDGNVYKIIDGQVYRLVVVLHEPEIVDYFDVDTKESMSV